MLVFKFTPKLAVFDILIMQLSIWNIGEVPVFQMNIKNIDLSHTLTPHVTSMYQNAIAKGKGIIFLSETVRDSNINGTSRSLFVTVFTVITCVVFYNGRQIPLLDHNNLFILVCISVQIIFVQDKTDIL